MNKDTEKFTLFEKTYWRYYLELEREMLETRRYVDFSEDNFTTYSVEFMKLYQAVCSEIDVFGKALAGEINSSFKPDDTSVSVHKWWFEVQTWYKSLKVKTVRFCQEYSLTPLDNYETEWATSKRGARYCRLVKDARIKTPSWWSEYTDVKHHRTSRNSTGKLNYGKANLFNLSNAFAALYILEYNFLKEIGDSVQMEKMTKSLLFANNTPLFVVENGCLCVVYDDGSSE